MLVPLVVYPTCEVVFFNPIQVTHAVAAHDPDYPGKDKRFTDMGVVGQPTVRMFGDLATVIGCLGGDKASQNHYKANFLDRVKSGALSPQKIQVPKKPDLKIAK